MLRNFFVRFRGQSLIELALILVLIAVIAIGSLTITGRRISTMLGDANCGLSGKTVHKDNGNGNSNRCK